MDADEHMPSAIAEAISAIMGKVKNVEKHGENKFHNYKFAKVEDLLFQVQPALAEAGLVLTQDEVRHEVVAETLMLATYAFSLSHRSGVTWGPVHHTGMASLRNTKGGFDDKALNKCHTAARKYFILGLFQIPAGDLPDADTEEDSPEPQRQAPRAEPRRAQAPEPRDAPPAAKPVDRSADVVPAPNTEDAEDWEAWRKVLAKKIVLAQSAVDIGRIVQSHAGGIEACDTLLPDTRAKIDVLVAERKAKLAAPHREAA